MRKLLLPAAFCAVLTSCAAGAPAFAGETKCLSVENVLVQIEKVLPLGARVVTFPRHEALAVLGFLVENIGPAPADMRVDAIIMVVGDRAASLLFVEHDKICRNVQLPLKAVEVLERTVRGRTV